ncbi:MAG: glycosyltransferase [Candidatus Sumerlaeia bacterium]|nr:glycosyltransferase [Candidatus Sumerlaeia bacterium]
MSPSDTCISVVVPFLNRVEDVSGCIASLRAQTVPDGFTVEIIAVDNGSTDGTREALFDEDGVRVVDCNRPGPAAARNEGISHASGELVALLDSDCRAREGWLAALVAPLKDPRVAVVGGRIYDDDPKSGIMRFAEEFGILNQESFFAERVGMPPFLATANVALRKNWWAKVNGFREDLRVGEDADFCWRVGDAGGALAYVDDAIVAHRHRDSFAGLFQWGFGYGEGTARLLALHRHRFPTGPHFAWGYYPALAAAPVLIPWKLAYAGDFHESRVPIYETVFRAGVVLGRWRGSLRHRVACL